MTKTGWLEHAKSNLLPLSEDKNNFFKAKKEWIYVGLFDNEEADFDCQLCGHKEIRYEYTIINKMNQNKMIVGSSCITKFIEHMAETHEHLYDTLGDTVTVQRVEQDKVDYWEKILFEALDSRFFRTEFQQSITKQIIKDGKLTINQAKCLRSFYDTLNQNEKTAFRKIVSIRLRKDNHKDQYKDLTALEKRFVLKLLNTQQKKRMRELYEG
ncbi:hypothetical protein FAD87_RS14490 [Enterococcus hirae]|uniref:hypothetical protein n=1 Tax=Enterococcus TaxID=1350 RepID=UPI0009BFADE1|nr:MULTISPECIES: hypothetical protein [Enterococcus]MBG7803751.1 hypothetical protein [Enterococcus faecium]MBG7953239.1 hypothetical protein [Enterococcus faecium]MBG8283158.1 hypothetical protein [Enterococcus faecium]MBH0946064.1 hypothetical protein [Enterococcus faecium]MBJ1178795.1 hypothetical protein [Enterococcus faecium]